MSEKMTVKAGKLRLARFQAVKAYTFASFEWQKRPVRRAGIVKVES